MEERLGERDQLRESLMLHSVQHCQVLASNSNLLVDAIRFYGVEVARHVETGRYRTPCLYSSGRLRWWFEYSRATRLAHTVVVAQSIALRHIL